MEVEEFLKEAAVMKEIKHPNLVQLLGMLLLLSVHLFQDFYTQIFCIKATEGYTQK